MQGGGSTEPTGSDKLQTCQKEPSMATTTDAPSSPQRRGHTSAQGPNDENRAGGTKLKLFSFLRDLSLSSLGCAKPYRSGSRFNAWGLGFGAARFALRVKDIPEPHARSSASRVRAYGFKPKILNPTTLKS